VPEQGDFSLLVSGGFFRIREGAGVAEAQRFWCPGSIGTIRADLPAVLTGQEPDKP
jgi:hypothetical protein